MPKSNVSPVHEIENWYAIHVRSNFEARVSNELQSVGLKVFYPAIEELHEWKDRQKKVVVPLFPGYLFSRFEPTAANQVKVLRTRGTVAIVGGVGRPTAVTQSEIETVWRMIGSGIQLSRHPLLTAGAWVRIKRGPLRGIEGSFARFSNHCRLVVTIGLLNQSVSAEVRLQDVEVVRLAAAESEQRIAAALIAAPTVPLQTLVIGG